VAQFEFDLIVIGSGPAGHSAAIQAAKLRKRVMVVERKAIVGGVCMNIGTIPSKTMREAVLYLSGYREHTLYGESYKVKEKITLADLLFRVEPVVRHESMSRAINCCAMGSISNTRKPRSSMRIRCGWRSRRTPANESSLPTKF